MLNGRNNKIKESVNKQNPNFINKGLLKIFKVTFCGYKKYNLRGNYPCKIKKCKYKKKNGRCSLKEISFNVNMKCENFIEKGSLFDIIFGDRK